MKQKVGSEREVETHSEYAVGSIHLMAPNPSHKQLLATNGGKVMGEVRVKVKLTNGVDEALVRRGLLAAEKIRVYEAEALVDTGAVKSVLPVQIVQQLGLAIVGRTRARYANDSGEDVDITEMVGIEINGRRTTEETLVLGSGVIIGQTVLESLDLLVDCVAHRVVPNPEHPDQPVINIR
jgi:clan AA aspartic protease